MNKLIIECVRGDDGDWKGSESDLPHSEYGGWWVLCDDVSKLWWSTKGWKRIKVILTKTPRKNAYKCRQDTNGCFWIQAEDTKKWHQYGIFRRLDRAITSLMYGCEATTETDICCDVEFYLGVKGVS